MSSRAELDIHVSSMVVENDVLMIHDCGRVANVRLFTEQICKVDNVPRNDCAVAHDYVYMGHANYLPMA